MKILITGGAGFVGSRLARTLLQRGTLDGRKIEKIVLADQAPARDELLADPTVTAIAIEGLNSESLALAHAAVDAGKHLWYDKPAGDNWPEFGLLIDKLREQHRAARSKWSPRPP